MNIVEKGSAPLIIISAGLLISVAFVASYYFFYTPNSQNLNNTAQKQSGQMKNSSIQESSHEAQLNPRESSVTSKDVRINCEKITDEEKESVNFLCQQNLRAMTAATITTVKIEDQIIKIFRTDYARNEAEEIGGIRYSYEGFSVNGESYYSYKEYDNYLEIAKKYPILLSPGFLKALRDDKTFNFLRQILMILSKKETNTPENVLRMIYELENEEFAYLHVAPCTIHKEIFTSQYIINPDVPKDILQDIINKPIEKGTFTEITGEHRQKCEQTKNVIRATLNSKN